MTTFIQLLKAPIVPPFPHHSAAWTMLVPIYKQQLKRVKPTVKTVKQSSVNVVRNFAAALNGLIGECSKRPQPTFTNTQGQSAITSPSANA